MKQELALISGKTLEHYNARAAEGREGTKITGTRTDLPSRLTSPELLTRTTPRIYRGVRQAMPCQGHLSPPFPGPQRPLSRPPPGAFLPEGRLLAIIICRSVREGSALWRRP